jgi:hypothetical protein
MQDRGQRFGIDLAPTVSNLRLDYEAAYGAILKITGSNGIVEMHPLPATIGKTRRVIYIELRLKCHELPELQDFLLAHVAAIDLAPATAVARAPPQCYAGRRESPMRILTAVRKLVKFVLIWLRRTRSSEVERNLMGNVAIPSFADAVSLAEGTISAYNAGAQKTTADQEIVDNYQAKLDAATAVVSADKESQGNLAVQVAASLNVLKDSIDALVSTLPLPAPPAG